MDHAAQAILAAIASFFVVTLLFPIIVLVCQHRKNTITRNNQIRTKPLRNPNHPNFNSSLFVDPSRSGDPNLKISIEKLTHATDNFSPHFIVDEGSFGLVYQAHLSTVALVAVKKLSRDAFQGFHEFKAEMETLSKLHHPNIVKILGFSVTKGGRKRDE